MARVRDQQVSLRFSEAEVALLQRAGRDPSGLTDAVRQLMAGGIKRVMESYQKPISRVYLNTEFGTLDSILREYGRFVLAVRRDAGLEDAGVRFEPVPQGTVYSDEHQQVYLVVGPNELVGEDGEIYTRKAT